MNVPTVLKVTGAAAILVFANYVSAQSTYNPNLTSEGNRWEVTAYLDSSAGHVQLATQGICFYDIGVSGTHYLYYWVSDTFPNWNGIATQEGDQIFMHGDYAEDVGHDGFEWEIVTSSDKNAGAGHWKEWREDGKFGNTIGFANAHFQRVGRCEVKDPFEALDKYYDIGFPRDEFGKEITLPFGDLKLILETLK
ncbi:hypothetical protein [Sessilibacter corallicola]|uniref:hypothetical protein n=1 Tax=Sessilibacter corallicola TaxID=2904075 RepID=UPI001E38EF27|nr:hypothetical protein [Sessilibacter corallicola]MCE2029160.1 hypothetical protein [Sessilibacter corallicola]